MKSLKKTRAPQMFECQVTFLILMQLAPFLFKESVTKCANAVVSNKTALSSCYVIVLSSCFIAFCLRMHQAPVKPVAESSAPSCDCSSHPSDAFSHQPTGPT